MSGRNRTRSTRHGRHRWWRAIHTTAAVTALLFMVAEVAVVAVSSLRPQRAQAAQAPTGQNFTVTPGDLHFIMKQIKIAEHHSATRTASNPCGTLVGPGPDQIPDRLTPYGLRTVDGSCNNLFPQRERYAAADETFPRLGSKNFRDAEGVEADALGTGSPAVASSSYKQKKGLVFDSQPRVISNLIVDQTSTNPAAVAAAGHPVRTQDPTASSVPCSDPPVPADPPDCTPAGKTLFIPNVTTDVGLSPPYNSWFTFFGQFFDHGVDQTVKSGGTVFVPLRADDPLRGMPNGPDGVPNTGDEVTKDNAFMVLTRAKNQPGPDGVLGDNPNTPQDESADDVQDATNTDTPLVDQSQTYTSHASHQVFLREYVASPAGRDGVLANNPATTADETLDNGGPVANGKLLGDSNRPAGVHGDTGMATWASVKRQSRTLLGINLKDPDLLDVPMLATDPYGEFIPGPHGLPQLVRKGPDGKPNTADDTLLEGSLTSPVDVPSDVVHFDTPFVGDIAHNADPSPRSNPGGPPTILTPDADHVVNDPQRPLPADPDGSTNHYDDELLDTHFCAGDGRVNENIALSAVHQIFHSEHDRLVDDIKHTLSTDPDSAADLHAFWQPTDPTPASGPNVAVDGDGWAGDRLFQAARFVTEMEYQHLVFEEFARKIQPNIRPFHVYHSDMNPVIPAEFAHAVYRFGHSMLDDDVARTTVDATGKTVDHSVPLLKGFLNPPEYFNSGDPANPWNASQAAGAIIMGSTDQAGNELDEFVTETLRNNLLGLPLDLPTINMTRAREAGVPSLNNLRREIHDKTNDAQLAPYTDWSDYGQHLKHPESLINYVAAYGEHPSIRDSGPDGILKDDPATGVDESADNVLTVKAKRLAATAIVDPSQLPAGSNVPIPTDAADFMFSTGFWATHETGLNNVDLWVGGLGEVTNLFGGLLGSTFNYVFQNTLENLQDGDRLYYLNRTPGMNLRTQLEGNSFAELAERNTDGTNSLKGDVFATSDCEFQLSALDGTPAGFTAHGSTVADDPNTECDETALLLRKPDGTIQYRARNSVNPSGINGQSTYNGTDVVDRIFGGNDNDTLWGNGGDDILEGNGGDDNTLGGDGNDIITDLDGADVLKGGDGNDAIDGGPGDDIIMSGNGSDFTNGGSFDNETFGGPGNDFIQLGQGADAAFGDSGDDWMQGGSGQDLIQGDHGAPFFDDPAESHPGNDVMVGQVGENDYDTEGGDDLMSQNSAIDRNAGAGGFDWAFHQYDTVGADDDMAINNNLLGLNLPVVVNRDRWQETEGDSGSPFNDVIKGDDETPAGVGGAGFTGCDALDQDGLNRITGLAELVPSLTADPAPTGVVSAASVATASATGTCPLSGNVWGDGNILLGGGGGDTIEGRGGNDIIDGDRALHARLSVRTDPANPDTELGTTDLMEGKPLNHDLTPNPTGNFGPGTDGMTLQQAVFAGKVDPGKIVMVREIVTEPSTGAANDVAVFSGPQADYDITQRDDGSVTVAHTRGAATDGTDTLRNIETLRFGGLTGTDVPLAPSAALTANTSADFGSVVAGAAAGSTRTFTLTNSGLNPLTLPATGKFAIAPGTDASLFTVGTTTCGPTLAANGGTCTVQVTFRPAAATATGAKSATLVATNNSGGVAGSTQTIALTGSVTAAPPPNRPATGVPTISDTTPQLGQTLTALTGNINDPDGLRTPPGFTFEWQASAIPTGTLGFLPIGVTTPSFTVPNNGLAALLRYRVVVRFTDAAGHAEAVTSAPTARPTTGPNTTGLTAPATAPLVTALGQALAPPQAPAPLRASTLSVSARPAAPLAVVTTVPKGASTVQITLFRLNAPAKSTKNRKVRSTSVHIATVYRKTTKAKRYVFRLTEMRFRNLKPGRYLIQVRVGSSRTSLGPAMSRQITITGKQSKTAR